MFPYCEFCRISEAGQERPDVVEKKGNTVYAVGNHSIAESAGHVFAGTVFHETALVLQQR